MDSSIQSDISNNDRGLAYGDGLFETIAYVNNELHNWNLHWQRLKKGVERLKLELPDEKEVLAEIRSALMNYSDDMARSNSTMPENNAADNNRIIKIILTRGQGGRGYLFPEQQKNTLIVTVHDWPERPEKDYIEGINVTVCETCLARQPALAGIKHLNRLEQVLARNEFSSTTFQEGIMLACSEQLSGFDALMIEGTSSNLFFVLNGQLYTPEIDSCGVSGTIRQAIINLAKQQGIDIFIDHYPLKCLRDATEVFFTNSVFGILPVASISIKEEQLRYTQRTISTQLALIINKELQRTIL